MTTQNEDITTSNASSGTAREVDLLRYREGKDEVPRVLRLVWTLMGIFTIYYCAKYMWPDLLEWMAK
jgi:hypothetical protein